MTTLIVCRSTEAIAELTRVADGLGEVVALDLTGGKLSAEAWSITQLYRPETASDVTTCPVAAAAIQAALAADPKIDLVLLDASYAARELAGYVAALLQSVVVTDAVGLQREAGEILVERTVLAGSWNTRCALRRGVGVVTLAPSGSAANAELAEPTDVGANGGQLVNLPVSPPSAQIEVVSRRAQCAGDRIGLDGAEIVVVAGRGVEGDLTLIIELADQLGAAVGATRVVTDEGWLDHSAQIGQTGVVIRPRIYLSFGVSGAIHHTVGMHNSEIIIAVNTDSEAPIFEIADFGIVGDLNNVLPQLLAALRS